MHIADYSQLIQDCENLLASVPTSAAKFKVSSIQALIKENAEIAAEIKSIQSSVDRSKTIVVPDLIQQLERNLLEIVSVYKDL